jgi:hypothetical protein
MGYEVVLRELEGGKHHDGTPFMVKRYYITWCGREPREDDTYLSVWADGLMVIHTAQKPVYPDHSTVFLYDDTWLGMIAALQQAMHDKRVEQERRTAQWLAENGDKREHYGYSVDLSINEAKDALAAAPMRWNEEKNAWKYTRLAEVYFDGEWRHLCRTDLADDVCTFGGQDAQLNLEELRAKYLQCVRFGARLGSRSRGTDSGRFAVVDAFSDG